MHTNGIKRRTILKTAAAALGSRSAVAQRASAGGPYRIFVTYSWSTNDIGDIGITPGLLRLLQKHIPNHEVTIVCNSRPEWYREYLGPRFPKCKVLDSPFRGPQPRSEEFMRAFQSADMLLYASGMVLNFGWNAHPEGYHNWNSTMAFALPLIMAREAHKPYGIYGHSFDQIDPPSEILLPPLFTDAKFIFARDTESLAHLKQLGVHSPIMEFGPDSTFGFDLRDEAYADNFLREYRLEPRRFVNLVFRSKVQGLGIDDRREALHAAKMRALVQQYVEKTGENVLVCPEVNMQMEPGRRLIVEPLPAAVREHVRWKPDFWTPDQAFSVFARARTHVSMDCHSVILALAAGTPSMHPRFVETGLKGWMLRDLGVREWLFDIDKDSTEDIIAGLMNIYSDYNGALAKVKRAQQIVARRQAETMAVVRQTMEAANRG